MIRKGISYDESDFMIHSAAAFHGTEILFHNVKSNVGVDNLQLWRNEDG
jgi:hypothetical protein